MYSVFTSLPPYFEPKVEVAACYLLYQNEVLFLKRHASRPQGGTWGVPAGKLEKGEKPKEAVIREVWEEIGLKLDENIVKEAGCLFIRLPQLDYIYHMFVVVLSFKPALQLALDEHDEERWVKDEEVSQLPLIKGGKEALDYIRINYLL